jgi:hypothetical protein
MKCIFVRYFEHSKDYVFKDEQEGVNIMEFES